MCVPHVPRSQAPQPYPCTLETCPTSDGMVGYQPDLSGNALFAALFGVMLVLQLGLGIRYKTWSYLVPMASGLILEVVGYAGRLLLHQDPFNFDYFIQYLVCLTIGPAFLTAAIYVTFTRVVYSCDERLSIIRPNKVSIIFMACDFVCLVLQAVGGAITATSNGMSADAISKRQMGVDIMIGGLALHVVSLFFFMSYASIYACRYHAARAGRYKTQHSHDGWRWKALITGLTTASVTIFARCVYRVAELREGFDSDLAHDEITFMVLEGAMIVIASVCLTLCHPGWCLDIPWNVYKTSSGTSSEENSYVDLANVHARK